MLMHNTRKTLERTIHIVLSYTSFSIFCHGVIKIEDSGLIYF